MALDAAEGVISLAEQHLANSLAASDRFQTWTNAANTLEASARIYFTTLPEPEANGKYTPDELAWLFPCALIYTDDAAQGSSIRKTGSGTAQANGLVAFRLYETVPEDNSLNFSEMERRWKNIVGVVMHEVLALSETAGCLAAVGIGNTEIYRADKDSLVFLDMNSAVVLVEWGTPQ